MNIDISKIWESILFAKDFIPVTLILIFVAFFLSLLLGTIIAVLRVSYPGIVAGFLRTFVAVMKGIPVYLFLTVSHLMFILYFDSFAEHFNLAVRAKDVDILYVAIIVMSLLFSCTMSEVVRGALLSVGRGQYEAGYSVGMTKAQVMRRIVIPQSIPVVIPSLSGVLIGLVKASSIAYTIGVSEILDASLRSASRSYSFLEAYIAAALIYWVMSILIEVVMGFLEKKSGKFKKQIQL